MDLFDFIAHNFPWLAGICLLLSVIFQVTKIPINPWGWLIKKISIAITSEVRLQLEEVKENTNTNLLDKYKK